MAFNRAGYNHIPYNVQSGRIKYIKVAGYEDVDAFVGSALQIFVLAIYNENISKSVLGASGYFLIETGSETIEENVVEGQLSVILYPKFEENVEASTEIIADIKPLVIGSEAVTENIHLGADIYPTTEASETVEANTALGAKIHPIVEGYELITESASLENVEQKTCVLTLTLRPGQTLIVDANNYNVLLNNQNAIEVQSGDWIDDLSRNTTDITISAASGMNNISATILYTERYL